MLLNIIFGKGTRQIPSRIGKNTNKYKQSCLGSKWNQPRSRNILFSWPWNLFPLQVKWGRGVGQMRPWTKKRTKFTSAKQISVIKEQDHCEAKFLNLKMEKFKFKWSKEPFIGPEMTKNRLKVGQRKLDARVKMEQQADVSAVKTLLWLELYPSKFLQNLSEMWEQHTRLIRRNASGSGLMSGKMPSKGSKTTSYSSTSARVDQQRAKEVRPRMGMAF